MYCNNCGKELVGTGVFCLSCETKQDKPDCPERSADQTSSVNGQIIPASSEIGNASNDIDGILLLEKFKAFPLWGKVMSAVVVAVIIFSVAAINSNRKENSIVSPAVTSDVAYDNGQTSQEYEVDASSVEGPVKFPEVTFPIKHNGLWGIADETGNIIIDFMYSNCVDVSDGLWSVRDNSVCGVVDSRNKAVIPFLYQDIRVFSDGLCAVKKDSLWGFVDEHNEVVIPFIYDDCDIFSDGLAAVKKEDFWGFINTKNETIIDFLYDEVGSEFKSGDTLARVFKHGYIGVSINGAWGIIDTTGAYTVPLSKEHYHMNIEEKVFINGNYIYNHEGKRIAEGQLLDYDDTGIIIGYESVAEVYVESKRGWSYRDWIDRYDASFIDYSGNTLVDYSDFYEKYESEFIDKTYFETIQGLQVVTLNEKKYLKLRAHINQVLASSYYNYMDIETKKLLNDNWIQAEDITEQDTFLCVNIQGNTEIYDLSLKKTKTLSGTFKLWHDDILTSNTNVVSSTGSDIRSATDDTVEYHFSKINQVSDNIAIVTDDNKIFQGLFIGDKLVFPTEYHSISHEKGEDSFVLRKAASEETIIVLKNGKVIHLTDNNTAAESTTEITDSTTIASSTVNDSVIANFNISGAWKQTYGSSGWADSNGRTIRFNNNNQCNIFSPQDTYGISARGNGGFTLSVTGLLGGNLTYWVKVIDNDQIEVYKTDRITLEFRFSRLE